MKNPLKRFPVLYDASGKKAATPDDDDTPGALADEPIQPEPVVTEWQPNQAERPKLADAGADDFGPPEEHMVSLLDKTSFEAEQFRTLRYFVEQKHRESDLRVVGVTSPCVGDGKTLIAINLAGALAQDTDARVLLIDADLRQPGVHRFIGIEGASSSGLVEAVLNSRLSLADTVVERSEYNLHVLPAGKPPASPYEVLKCQSFQELMDETRRFYDYVVVDTPPVLACPDVHLIENRVDGFLLVLSAHKTPKKLVDEAIGELSEEKIMGLVFNQDDHQRKYYSRYRYKYGTKSKSWWREWRGRKKEEKP